MSEINARMRELHDRLAGEGKYEDAEVLDGAAWAIAAIETDRDLIWSRPTPALLRAWAELPEMERLEVRSIGSKATLVLYWLADALERAVDHK